MFHKPLPHGVEDIGRIFLSTATTGVDMGSGVPVCHKPEFKGLLNVAGKWGDKGVRALSLGHTQECQLVQQILII